MMRVPLWRDGLAPLGRVVNHRVVWVALALIVGIDSISIAISKGRDLGIARIVLPAVLCAAGVGFALWQLWLVVTAARRSARNGGKLWHAGLAVIGAALGALAIAGILHFKAIPQLEELWEIHHGDERMGDLHVIVADDGRTMVIDGTLGIGAAAQVKAALDAHPAVRTIVMGGPGGRIGPAYQIAQLIRLRKLDTRVERVCNSACTVMFLGGAQRSLGPFGRLGFHRLSFPGMDESELANANRQLRDFLTFNGITGPFVRRVMDTPSDSIWVPTPEELLDAGVIHHSDAGRN